jgi:4-hydroxybenzoate polyprenyltransferase
MTILRLLRAKQWIKNLFVFAPLIFSGLLREPGFFEIVAAVFVVFCLLSSAVYIVNDLFDLESDKRHPIKMKRPLAAGVVSKPAAFFILSTLFLTAFGYGYWLNIKNLLLLMVLYALLHLFYSLFLKKMVIVDAMAVALGFELRVWAGSVAIGITPSVWLQLCVFLLTLFLSFAKRRHEKITLEQAAEHRGVLERYDVYFLDQMIVISAALSVIFYCLYVFSSERRDAAILIYTIPFVIYGIFRYLYLVNVKRIGGEPGDAIFLDAPFALNLFLWGVSVVAVFYFF